MVISGQIERLRRGISKWLVRLAPLRWLGGKTIAIEYELLGDGDGSWTIPKDFIEPDSICYCFGVGCDASFDVAVAEKFAAQVHSFDPTPSSIEYMRQHPEWPVFFYPWGIWNRDTTKSLFQQDVFDNTNLSLINPGDYRGGKQLEVELFSLKTIMRRLEHNKIALIKIDIEGAWFEVLKNMIENAIVPDVLCVEFDSPTSLVKVVKTIKHCYKAGLICIHRQRDDYLFVKETKIADNISRAS